MVTLTGVGFGSNASEVAVSMDDFACDVTSVADDEIICETTTSERVHHVDNFGKHECKFLQANIQPYFTNWSKIYTRK